MFCSDFLPYKSFMKINKDQLNKEKKKLGIPGGVIHTASHKRTQAGKNEQNYARHGLYSCGQVNYIFTRCNYTRFWGLSRSTRSLINARTGRSLEVNKTFPPAGSPAAHPSRLVFPADLPQPAFKLIHFFFFFKLKQSSRSIFTNLTTSPDFSFKLSPLAVSLAGFHGFKFKIILFAHVYFESLGRLPSIAYPLSLTQV